MKALTFNTLQDAAHAMTSDQTEVYVRVDGGQAIPVVGMSIEIRRLPLDGPESREMRAVVLYAKSPDVFNR